MAGSPLRRTVAALLATFAATGGPAPAQVPTLQVLFRASAATARPTAIAWLRGHWLPGRPEWPRDLGRDAAVVVTWDAAGLRIAGTAAAPPDGALAIASLRFDGGPAALGTLAPDGREDWFVPVTTPIPPAWLELLRALGADSADGPRTLDAAVLAGHFAGAIADGDPRGELVRFGALCGEVTFASWRTETHLRVRGRSDGGLLLPAALLVALADGPRPRAEPLALRAFAARDGDRAEAARQLLLAGGPRRTHTLRALLHADDELRLVAIDALVRGNAAEQLPDIVAAAAPGLPLATAAATDALLALWPGASPAVRQRTRGAIARSTNSELRRLDPGQELAAGAAPPPGAATDSGNARLLLVLLVSGLALYGFWLRERCGARPN